MAFFITDGILDFLLNQRLLDMTHYIKSFIAATLLSLLFPLTMMAQEEITDLGTFPTWNKRQATVHKARITKNTRLILTKDYARMNPVYDGVFSVEENGLLSFYLANGAKRITNTMLRSISASEGSRFSGNSVMTQSKDKKGSYYPFVILHRNGTMKELYPERISATNFADGLARVAMNDHQFMAHSFFIDENGKKVLSQYNYDQQRKGSGGGATTVEVKPVVEGLRPFYSRNDRKWGYLDAKGNTVIKPQFSSARCFSEGYAAVTLQDANGNSRVAFIDKSGKVTYDTGILSVGVDTDSRIGDVHSGILCVRHTDRTAISYYSPQGRLLKTFEGYEGTDAVNGHIFLRLPYSTGSLFMLDTGFKPLREIAIDESSYWNLPKFNRMGLAQVNEYAVINSDGDVVFKSVGAEKMSEADIAVRHDGGTISSLCDEGYVINTYSIDYNEYQGVTDMNGECIALLLPEDVYNSQFKTLPGWNSLKQPETIPPGDDDGDNDNDNDNVKYPVCVVCDPEEGGTATGAGSYTYGTKIQVDATANEGYRFSGLICSDNISRELGAKNVFEVRDTMTILVKFLKKDTSVEPPVKKHDGYLGKVNFSYGDANSKMNVVDKVDLYMELSQNPDISTPYGNVYGFMQVQFDPSKRYSTNVTQGGYNTEEVVGSAEMSLYSAPYKILGFTMDEGKKWMIISGGGGKAGGLKVDTNTSSNPFAGLQFARLYFDGFSSIKMDKKTYRVQITGVGADGSITLGKLEAFSPQFGWVKGQDRRLYSTKFVSSKMVTQVDNGGLAEGYFQGVVMKPVERREVEWSTPKVWFDTFLKKNGIDSDAMYERIRQKTMEHYKNFKGVYTQFWED